MSFDAIGFLRDNGIQYFEEGPNVQRGWVGVRCPFCYDHSNHGGFNLAEGYFSCWKCGGHRVTHYIQEMLRVPEHEAIDIYEDYSSRTTILTHLNNKKVAKAKKVEMPGDELNKFHIQYLKARRFDPAFIVEKYKTKGTGPVGVFKLRLMIPIIYHSETVSFTGRDITGKQLLRYKTLGVEESMINPKHTLYNLDNCKENWVGVTEGIFDCWRMGDNYCATLGTTLTDQQIRLLSFYDRVVFLFDSEDDAQARAYKYGTQLSALGVKKVLVVDAESGKDPGDFSERMAERVRQKVRALL
jgi:DNA primase